MGNWKFEPLRATDETVQPLPQDTRYPDISSVLPHHEAEITPNGDFLLDAAEITLNGDFLLDALGPMRGTSVTLRFSSYALEIMSTVSGEPVYALIVHTHAQPTTWRPRKEQNERTDEMAQGV